MVDNLSYEQAQYCRFVKEEFIEIALKKNLSCLKDASKNSHIDKKTCRLAINTLCLLGKNSQHLSKIKYLIESRKIKPSSLNFGVTILTIVVQKNIPVLKYFLSIEPEIKEKQLNQYKNEGLFGWQEMQIIIDRENLIESINKCEAKNTKNSDPNAIFKI